MVGRFSICPAGDTLARKYHSQSPTSEATGPTVLAVQLPDDETFCRFIPATTPSDHRPQECGHRSGLALLYFWGSQGSGRSHLLHATCAEVNARDAAAAISPSISSEQLDPSMLDALESLPWSVSTAWRRSPATPCGSGPCSTSTPLEGEGGDAHRYRLQRATQAGAATAGSASRLDWGVSFHLDELDDEGQTQRPATARAELRVSSCPSTWAVSCSTASPATCLHPVCHPQSSRQRLLPCQAQAYHPFRQRDLDH